MQELKKMRPKGGDFASLECDKQQAQPISPYRSGSRTNRKPIGFVDNPGRFELQLFETSFQFGSSYSVIKAAAAERSLFRGKFLVLTIAPPWLLTILVADRLRHPLEVKRRSGCWVNPPSGHQLEQFGKTRKINI